MEIHLDIWISIYAILLFAAILYFRIFAFLSPFIPSLFIQVMMEAIMRKQKGAQTFF